MTSQTDDIEQQASEGAREAISRLKQEGSDLIWTLRNGVEIRCTPVPQSYLQALREAMPPPRPPVVPGAHGETEENPDDPRYKIDLERHQEAYEQAALKLVLGMGTSIESLPDGFIGPDNDKWIDKVHFAETLTGRRLLQDADLEAPELRYVAWLRFYAIDNETDLSTIGFFPQHLGGLRQAEVAAAVDAFRMVSQRGTDPAGAPGQQAGLRPAANRAPRRSGSRVR